MRNAREGIVEPIPHSVIGSARDSQGKRQLLCSPRSSSQAWTPPGKWCSHVAALEGQMLPPVSPNGLASQSFWALTSVGDTYSQAFHLGDKPGFRGKKCICTSHPVPSTLGLSGPTTLHLFPSGWKNFNYNFYQEETIQTALDLSSNIETTSVPIDKEAHLTHREPPVLLSNKILKVQPRR